MAGVDQEGGQGDGGDGGTCGEHPDEDELDRPGEHRRGNDRGQPPREAMAGDQYAEADAEREQPSQMTQVSRAASARSRCLAACAVAVVSCMAQIMTRN